MNNVLDIIKRDFRANAGNYEVCLYLFFFRLGTYLKQTMDEGGVKLLLFPLKLVVRLIYKMLSIIYLMEISLGTKIGAGFTIYHLKGIVINAEAVIGDNVVINHFVTLGSEVTLGNGVIINPQSVIIKSNIGNNAVVGAGSVVTKDVEENTIVAGCPAKLIKRK